jgi:N-acetylneuraminate synthase
VNQIKPLIIAEIGINFAFGDSEKNFIDNIKKLILLAKESGADVVKFQKRNPELCVPISERNKEKVVPWRNEPTTYLEYKKQIELTFEEYKEIDKFCKENEISWSVSVWDLESAFFINQFSVPFIKVPSAKITHTELIRYLSNCGKPLIMSTGMSTEKEIDDCINLIRRGNCPSLTVLHCNSSYPAKDDELNLSYISVLKEKYPDCIIGYSGHDLNENSSLVAYFLGAKVFERHITLDKSLWGTDQTSSLNGEQFKRMSDSLNLINVWLGEPVKKVWPSEVPIRNKLRG